MSRPDEYAVGPTGWGGIVRTILTTSGPVALLAIGLTVFLGHFVWNRLGTIEANQHAIMESMTKANVAMAAFVAQHNEVERERQLLMQTQIKLLRQLCVNSAKSEFQTRACME